MAVIVIIGVIVSVFTILYFSPLDAAYSILGQNATKAQIHQFNVLHHLNEPYFIQLWDTIKGVFTFDLGTTYKGNEVVTKAVGEKNSNYNNCRSISANCGINYCDTNWNYQCDEAK